MTRWLLREAVNWWIDAKQPPWLASLVKRDRDLQRYDREIEQLTGRLRDEASRWAAQVEADMLSNRGPAMPLRRCEPPRRAIHRRLPVVCLAAAALLVIAGTTLLRGPRFDAEPLSITSPSEPNISREVVAVATAWTRSARRIEQSVTNLVRFQAEPVAGSTMDSTLLGGSLRQSVESASRNYGKALAFVDSNIKRQLETLGGLRTTVKTARPAEEARRHLESH